MPQRRRTLGPWSAGQWVGVLGVIATAVLVVVALLASTARPPTRLIRAHVTSTGSAQLQLTGDRGELFIRHLSRLPRGRVYEVWTEAAHRKPVPAEVLFLVSRHGDADVPLPRSLRGVNVVFVTAEPSGGSPLPTGKPAIRAQLTK